MTHHLLIAHGSPDSRHRDTMQFVAKAVDASLPSCQVAFLEHDTPRVSDWLASCTGDVVALGMLLAPGYHATIDVPRLLDTAPRSTRVDDRGPLGTGPWLNRTLDWLVEDVGGTARTPVVLAVAGSTRSSAQQSLRRFVTQWQDTRPGAVQLAAATGPGRSLHDVTAAVASEPGDPVPVVLPLMVAPGVLADRARAVASAHGLLTTGALADAPTFADAVIERLSA